MKMEISLQPRLEQRLKLAPQIIQSIEILQLPIMALQERITQELEENPVLEVQEEQEELPQPEPVKAEPEYEKLADLADNWQDFYQETRPFRSPFRGSSGDGDEDEKLEALQNTPAKPVTLQEHLLSQLGFLDLEPEIVELAENIIGNLDSNGYLEHPLEDIVKATEKDFTEEQAREALKVVQSLEPRGVGARDLAECLLLQLDPDDPEYETKKLLITTYLEDIEKNKLPQIARKIGKSIEDLKDLIAQIGTLNPKPGALYGAEPPPYIVPDVIVEKVNDDYEVTLQEHHLPSLYISPQYRRMLRDRNGNKDTKEWIRRKIESAKWLIESIEQRRSTLYRVAVKIVEKQRAFLDHGISHLKPLKMQDVADEIHVHISTVSRAIAHKYMQTPRGIFDMKFFFTGGLNKADGNVEAWDSVRQKLLEIIQKEDKRHPLSDKEIESRLKAQGIDIARRTVTKYREALNIPSSRKRKVY